MIPAFLAYISGTTLSELNQKDGTKTVSKVTEIKHHSQFCLFCTRIFCEYFNIRSNNQQYTFSTSGELLDGFNQIGGQSLLDLVYF